MALKGIVREGGHGNVVARPHGQAEKCGNRLCVLVQQLVFVSYSKEKQHVGMGLFGGVILLNYQKTSPVLSHWIRWELKQETIQGWPSPFCKAR